MTVEYNKEYAEYEFKLHGEEWILNRLQGKLNMIYDVGANIGEWSRMARRFNPNAHIHMFEIVPQTYRQLLSNIPIDEKMYPNGFGLSNEYGKVLMKYCPHYPAISSSIMDLRLDNSFLQYGLTMIGDDYAESRMLDCIDYLKIDVEGAEEKVIKGFQKCLEQRRIKVIQFEYGLMAILTKWLLKDAYQYLTPYGFRLGRLTDGRVDFHEYTLLYETFNGPDYVAVHEDSGFIDLLV